MEALQNVVIDGILGDLQVAYDHRRSRAVLILVFCGIDALAFSASPDGRNTRRSFIAWANDHFDLPGVSAEELYASRCSYVHAAGAVDPAPRHPVRTLGYHWEGPPVTAHPEHPELAMVTIPALKRAFVDACIRYVDWASADPARMGQVLARLRECAFVIPV